MRIILASASPRRRALLEQIGLPYTVMPADVPEEMDSRKPPGELVALNAGRKALFAADCVGSVDEVTLIIAADTVVRLDGRLMGKPSDAAEAERMLTRLSGKRHEVYTGVCLTLLEESGKRLSDSFVSIANVYMRDIPLSEIRAYSSTDEPADKAGAYGIQGRAAVFIKKIDGDFYTVVGLPLFEMCLKMRGLGVELENFWM